MGSFSAKFGYAVILLVFKLTPDTSVYYLLYWKKIIFTLAFGKVKFYFTLRQTANPGRGDREMQFGFREGLQRPDTSCNLALDQTF